MEETTSDDVLDTLEVIKVQRRTSAGGAWVAGRIAGHRFFALVFPEPAADRTWEVNADSRISKFWLQRIEDGATVYNWDRGEDIAPRTVLAGLIVNVLAEGLADLVWGWLTRRWQLEPGSNAGRRAGGTQFSAEEDGSK